MSKWIKVSGSFGFEGDELAGSFSSGRKRMPEDEVVLREDKDFATLSPSVGELKRYIVSKCKGDAYEIFLWSEGKSIVNNPPVEIRKIIMGMNPKITGSNFVIDNIDAVNYFKAWVPMKTLGDEAFEYILDNNEDYLKLYIDFGRPTEKQNIEIIKKLESEDFDYDNFRALDKAEQQLKSSKAIRKIRF